MAAVVLAASLTACSSSHGAFAPVAGRGTQQAASQNVTLSIAIPKRTPASTGRLRALFISSATQSVSISQNGGTPVVANLTAGSPNCTSGASALTCTIALSVLPGTVTFTEKLFDQPGAAGNLLATGQQTATIVQGQANTVRLTLNGVVANVVLSFASPPVQGTTGSTVLSVAAQDADKQTIIADPYNVPITVSLGAVTINARARRAALSGSSSSALLSLNGGTPSTSVTVTQPTDVVTLVYDGSALATTVTATATGVPASNAPPLAVAPKTPSTADWNRMGFDGARTSYNPKETTLSTANVANLKQNWAFPLAAPYANTQPIAINNVQLPDGTYTDMVFVGDEHGDFYGVNAANGNAVWNKTFGSENEGCTDMPDNIFGNTSAPLYDRATNRLYLLATALPENSDHTKDVRNIFAFDPATGNSANAWPGGGVLAYTNAYRQNTYSGLNLSADGKSLYWDSSSNCDSGTYYGFISSLNTTSQTITATFEAVTSGDQAKGYYANGIWSWGNPSIDPDTGALFASVGNSLGPDEHATYSDSVISLNGAGLGDTGYYQSPSGTLNSDLDFGTTPVAYDDGGMCTALSRKDGNLFSFDRTNLAAGPKSTINIANALASPAYDPVTHMIYVGTNSYEGASSGGHIQAFATNSGCTLTHVWTSDSTTQYAYSSVPSVANGVVYVAGYSHVYAVNASSGATLWTSPALSGVVIAEPTVVNGHLYVLAWGYSGHATLYGFGL